MLFWPNPRKKGGRGEKESRLALAGVVPIPNTAVQKGWSMKGITYIKPGNAWNDRFAWSLSLNEGRVPNFHASFRWFLIPRFIYICWGRGRWSK